MRESQLGVHIASLSLSISPASNRRWSLREQEVTLSRRRSKPPRFSCRRFRYRAGSLGRGGGSADLEDGPANLRSPLLLIWCVMGSDEVVLSQGPLDGERVLRY